jgi:hypothetical protein
MTHINPKIKKDFDNVLAEYLRSGDLLLFSDHLDRFLRTLVCADTTSFAEPEINIQILVDNRVRAVHGTQTAGIAFLPVNCGFEHPPGSRLPCRPFLRPAYRKAFT